MVCVSSCGFPCVQYRGTQFLSEYGPTSMCVGSLIIGHHFQIAVNTPPDIERMECSVCVLFC